MTNEEISNKVLVSNLNNNLSNPIKVQAGTAEIQNNNDLVILNPENAFYPENINPHVQYSLNISGNNEVGTLTQELAIVNNKNSRLSEVTKSYGTEKTGRIKMPLNKVDLERLVNPENANFFITHTGTNNLCDRTTIMPGIHNMILVEYENVEEPNDDDAHSEFPMNENFEVEFPDVDVMEETVRVNYDSEREHMTEQELREMFMQWYIRQYNGAAGDNNEIPIGAGRYGPEGGRCPVYNIGLNKIVTRSGLSESTWAASLIGAFNIDTNAPKQILDQMRRGDFRGLNNLEINALSMLANESAKSPWLYNPFSYQLKLFLMYEGITQMPMYAACWNSCHKEQLRMEDGTYVIRNNRDRFLGLNGVMSLTWVTMDQYKNFVDGMKQIGQDPAGVITMPSLGEIEFVPIKSNWLRDQSHGLLAYLIAMAPHPLVNVEMQFRIIEVTDGGLNFRINEHLGVFQPVSGRIRIQGSKHICLVIVDENWETNINNQNYQDPVLTVNAQQYIIPNLETGRAGGVAYQNYRDWLQTATSHLLTREVAENFNLLNDMNQLLGIDFSTDIIKLAAFLTTQHSAVWYNGAESLDKDILLTDYPRTCALQDFVDQQDIRLHAVMEAPNFSQKLAKLLGLTRMKRHTCLKTCSVVQMAKLLFTTRLEYKEALANFLRTANGKSGNHVPLAILRNGRANATLTNAQDQATKYLLENVFKFSDLLIADAYNDTSIMNFFHPVFVQNSQEYVDGQFADIDPDYLGLVNNYCDVSWWMDKILDDTEVVYHRVRDFDYKDLKDSETLVLEQNGIGNINWTVKNAYLTPQSNHKGSKSLNTQLNAIFRDTFDVEAYDNKFMYDIKYMNRWTIGDLNYREAWLPIKIYGGLQQGVLRGVEWMSYIGGVYWVYDNMYATHYVFGTRDITKHLRLGDYTVPVKDIYRGVAIQFRIPSLSLRKTCVELFPNIRYRPHVYNTEIFYRDYNALEIIGEEQNDINMINDTGGTRQNSSNNNQNNINKNNNSNNNEINTDSKKEEDKKKNIVDSNESN